MKVYAYVCNQCFIDQITKSVYNSVNCQKGTLQSSSAFLTGCRTEYDVELGNIATNFQCSTEPMSPILPVGGFDMATGE
jgi:hypothetical protein